MKYLISKIRKNTKKIRKEVFRTNKNIPFNSISFYILLIHSTKNFEVFRSVLKIESERKFKFFNYLIIPLFYCILWNIFPASIDFKMIIVEYCLSQLFVLRYELVQGFVWMRRYHFENDLEKNVSLFEVFYHFKQS